MKKIIIDRFRSRILKASSSICEIKDIFSLYKDIRKHFDYNTANQSTSFSSILSVRAVLFLRSSNLS